MKAGKMNVFVKTVLEELRRGEDVMIACSSETEARRIYDLIAGEVSPAQLKRLSVSQSTGYAPKDSSEETQ